VQVAIPVFDEVEWATVFEQMVEQAGYAARLLAGEMPHEIEQVFERAGVDLLPSDKPGISPRSATVRTGRTPVMHIAAVCYLVAEAFDADPFLLFALRGCEREPLLGELPPASPGGRYRSRLGGPTGRVGLGATSRLTCWESSGGRT